jgi:hypothetical protein
MKNKRRFKGGEPYDTETRELLMKIEGGGEEKHLLEGENSLLFGLC